MDVFQDVKFENIHRYIEVITSDIKTIYPFVFLKCAFYICIEVVTYDINSIYPFIFLKWV